MKNKKLNTMLLKNFGLCLALNLVFFFSFSLGEIIQISPDTFDQTISSSPYTLINFHSYLSDTSKAFSPIYAQIADELTRMGSNIQIAVADVSRYFKFGEKFSILTFPTVKLFVKGSKLPIQYLGPLDAPSLISWIHARTGRVSQEISAQEELENVLNTNELSALLIGSPQSKSFEEYIEAARHFDNIAFMDSTNEDISRRYEIEEQKEGLIFFKNFGKEKITYDRALTFNTLRRFFNGQRYGGVSLFDRTVQHRIFEAKEDVVILLKANDEIGNRTEEVFRDAAAKLGNDIGFTVAPFGKNLEFTFFGILKVNLLQMLDIAKEELPAVAIIQPQEKNRKFFLAGEITVESIETFVQDYFEHKMRPYIQSGPLPPQPTDENVRILVGKTFSSAVFNDEKDVLVSFCAPKIHKCALVSDVIQSVAEKLKSVKNLLIAKMDTLENDIEIFDKIQVPSLALFSKGNKEAPVLYKGPLDEVALIKFLEDHISLTMNEEEEINTENNIENIKSIEL